MKRSSSFSLPTSITAPSRNRCQSSATCLPSIFGARPLTRASANPSGRRKIAAYSRPFSPMPVSGRSRPIVAPASLPETPRSAATGSGSSSERASVAGALGAIGTDDILLELEAELAQGNWLTPGADAHRQAVARIIARIGTPRARALLERGAESKRAGARAACIEALSGLRVRRLSRLR